MANDNRTPSSKPQDKKDQKVRDLPDRKVTTEKEGQVKGGASKPVFDQE